MGAYARLRIVIALSVASCGDDGGPSSSGDDTSNGDASSTLTASATVATGSTSADSTGSFGESGGAPECILWEPNQCPDEQKCMPWSLDDDTWVDDVRCCDEVDEPDQVGQPCQVIDYLLSCLDTCIDGAMCFVDDPVALTGLCLEFCEPAVDDCEPDFSCSNWWGDSQDGTPNVPLCHRRCDPIAQDCPDPGWACFGGGDGFACLPDAELPAPMFEPCTFPWDCGEGNFCTWPMGVPGCAAETGCCVPFCDLNEPNADAMCQALLPEADPPLICFGFPDFPPEWSHVGTCEVPYP